MCLTICDVRTNEFRRQNKDKQEVTVYKVLKVIRFEDGPIYITPYIGNRVSPNMVLRATFPDKPPFRAASASYYYIDIQGVHAFTSKYLALAFSKMFPDSIIVECTGKMSDFIAVGYDGDIAFKALTFGELTPVQNP